ncbi:hypothetical protein AQEC111735_09970 [Aquirufa ecclesiirivi]|nr:hypothetical protein [Aquirufa ecclesiirivi]
MKTETSIVSQFELLTEQRDDQKLRAASFLKLNEANKRYFRLIESGLMQKRGYTLLGIEDVHLHRIKKI